MSGIAAALMLALAAPCPAPEGASPALAAVDSELRLRFLADRLGPAAHRARVWTWGWGAASGVFTVGQAVPAFVVSDHGLRADLAVGAATSAVGLALLVLAPLESMRVDSQLERDLARNPPDRCALLAGAERDFAAAAANESFGVSGWLHAGNLLVNAAAGLLLWLAWGRALSGLLTFASGAALGELMIFTQPSHLDDDLARYRQGDLSLRF